MSLLFYENNGDNNSRRAGNEGVGSPSPDSFVCERPKFTLKSHVYMCGGLESVVG